VKRKSFLILVGVMSGCSIAPLAEAEPAPLPSAMPVKRAKEKTHVEGLAAAMKPTREVVYKKAGDRELRLHIFEPPGHLAKDKRTCYVVIHGGGWTGGTPSRMYPLAITTRSAACLGSAWSIG
jgi:acetyl esterase